MATFAERAAAATVAVEQRAQRLAAAEATVAQAQQAAEAEAAVAWQAATTAVALRRELWDEQPLEEEEQREEPRDRRRPLPQRSPKRMCRQSRSSDTDRRCRRGGRGRSPVIQTVYKDSGGSTTWPMLSKTNYHE